MAFLVHALVLALTGLACAASRREKREPQSIREEIIASGELIGPRYPDRNSLANLLTSLNRAILHDGRGRRSDRSYRASVLALRGGGPDFHSRDGKAWHALGYSVGRTLVMGDLRHCSEQEVEDIVSGIKAALLGQAPKGPLEDDLKKAGKMIEERKDKKAKETAAAGKKALQAAAKEGGAKKTSSGLVMLSLVEGSGESPTAGDTVEVHYEGALVDGTIFDSSFARGKPVSLPMGAVIKGWAEGLTLMKVGGEAKLTIPAELAFGENGRPPVIPPQSVLVFKVKLLGVKKEESK